MFKFPFLFSRHVSPPLKNQSFFSYEGPWVLSFFGTQAQLWNTESGNDIGSILNHRTTINAVAFFPLGDKIITATEGSELSIWDTLTGTRQKTFSANHNPILACAVAPDKSKIICGTSKGNLLVFDVKNYVVVKTIQAHPQAILTCAISPDNHFIVTGSDDKFARVWALDTGKMLQNLNSHTDGVTACGFSFDGKKIITGSHDTTVKIWDAATGFLDHTLEGHTDSVTCVAFSVDGQKIVSGSNDTTLRIWNAVGGSLLRTIHCCSGAVNAVAFYPNGQSICSSFSDNTIKTWNVSSGKLQTVYERSTDKKNKIEAMNKVADILPNYKMFQDGKREEAISQVIQLRDSIQEIVGRDHLINTIPGQALGKMYIEMDDFTYGLNNYQRVLEIQQLILGLDHPDTVATTNIIKNIKNREKFFNLNKLMKEINILIKRGEHENAIKKAQDASYYAGEHFGKSSNEYATTLINLATIYQTKKEEYIKAGQLLRESLSIKEKIFGENHPDVGEIYFYLGAIALTMGKIDEARSSLIKAITIRKKVQEGWDEDIARELDNLSKDIHRIERMGIVKETHEVVRMPGG